MSRDQFSQLMLVYTGMAADIVEIFEAFRESKVSDQFPISDFRLQTCPGYDKTTFNLCCACCLELESTSIQSCNWSKP